MNKQAIKISFRFAAKARGWKSKLVFLTIAINHQAARWERLRSFLRSVVALFSTGKNLRLRTAYGDKTHSFSIRKNNAADYQTMYECFGEKYFWPHGKIRYVLDGGAHIGLFAINAWLRYDIKEMICVEPLTGNLELLSINTLSLPVTIIEGALTDENGTANFNIADDNTGNVVGSAGHPWHRGQTEITSLRLEKIIPSHWVMENTLLKLDIEGQEYKVFTDMISSGIFPGYILAELHDYFRAGGEAMIKILESQGYTIEITGDAMEGNVTRQIYAERNNFRS